MRQHGHSENENFVFSVCTLGGSLSDDLGSR